VQESNEKWTVNEFSVFNEEWDATLPKVLRLCQLIEQSRTRKAKEFMLNSKKNEMLCMPKNVAGSSDSSKFLLAYDVIKQ
jgi:hypothetical protein